MEIRMYVKYHASRFTTETNLMISLLNILEKLRFCCNNAKQQIYARTTKLQLRSMQHNTTTESSTLTKLQAMYKVNF